MMRLLVALSLVATVGLGARSARAQDDESGPLGPDASRKLFASGMKSYKKKAFAQARTDFAAAVDADDRNTEARYRLAAVMSLLGDGSRAMDAVTELVQLAVNDDKAAKGFVKKLPKDRDFDFVTMQPDIMELLAIKRADGEFERLSHRGGVWSRELDGCTVPQLTFTFKGKRVSVVAIDCKKKKTTFAGAVSQDEGTVGLVWDKGKGPFGPNYSGINYKACNGIEEGCIELDGADGELYLVHKGQPHFPAPPAEGGNVSVSAPPPPPVTKTAPAKPTPPAPAKPASPPAPTKPAPTPAAGVMFVAKHQNGQFYPVKITARSGTLATVTAADGDSWSVADKDLKPYKKPTKGAPVVGLFSNGQWYGGTAGEVTATTVFVKFDDGDEATLPLEKVVLRTQFDGN